MIHYRAPSTLSTVRGAGLLSATFLVVLVGAALVLTRIYAQFDQASLLGRTIVAAQRLTDGVLQHQLDEETGLRGYAATGDRAFLEPYMAAHPSYESELGRLERVAKPLGSAKLDATIADIRDIHRKWEREIGRPLIGNPRGPGAVRLQALGKALTDRLRRDVARIDDLLQRRLDSARADSLARVRAAFIGGLLLIAVLASAAIVFVFSRAVLQRRVERSRETVETLQRAFLTDLEPLGGTRIGSVYWSATRGAAVGGDLFDSVRLDKSQGLVMIGDISGKGLDAAVNSAFVKYSIRALAHQRRDPAQVLAAFNELFLQTIDDPYLFVAVFVGLIDVAVLRFTYASAGLAGAFLRRDSEVSRLAVTGPIIGLSRGLPYEMGMVDLERGDQLVLVTDGLTEARDRKGAFLGLEGAAEWIRNCPAEPQACAERLAMGVRRRTRGSLHDDLALLVISVDGE